MRRRELLAAVGTIALAGCPTNGTGDGTGNGTPSCFAGEPCPPVGGSSRTCHHSTADGAGAVVLEPDAEYLDAPGPARFTLYNRTDAAVSVGLPTETLARRFDDRWQRVPAQRQDNLETASVAAGDSLRFGLAHGDWRELSDVAHTLAGIRFGAGEFVFGVRAFDRAFEPSTALARFDVGGDRLTVSPPDRPATDRDGSTMLVYPAGESGPIPTSRATFTEVTDAADLVAVAPEVFASRDDVQAATFLRREGINTVVVGLVDDYFRTPVEWLEAANVWQGSDRAYAIGGVTFTVRGDGVA